jgi:hypothetical protein
MSYYNLNPTYLAAEVMLDSRKQITKPLTTTSARAAFILMLSALGF